MDEKPRRRNRILDGPRAVTKNISMPSNLAEALSEEALKEGHRNVSRVVVSALIDYFNRKHDPRAA